MTASKSSFSSWVMKQSKVSQHRNTHHSMVSHCFWWGSRLTILSPRQKLDWLDHHFCLVKIRILPFAESISPHVPWSNDKKILYESKFFWSESIQIPKVVSFSCLLLKWPKIRMFFSRSFFTQPFLDRSEGGWPVGTGYASQLGEWDVYHLSTGNLT